MDVRSPLVFFFKLSWRFDSHREFYTQQGCIYKCLCTHGIRSIQDASVQQTTPAHGKSYQPNSNTTPPDSNSKPTSTTAGLEPQAPHRPQTTTPTHPPTGNWRLKSDKESCMMVTITIRPPWHTRQPSHEVWSLTTGDAPCRMDCGGWCLRKQKRSERKKKKCRKMNAFYPIKIF